MFYFLYEDDEREWKKQSIFFVQYALKYYYSNSTSVFGKKNKNTVTVIVRVFLFL
jgi:hypothetical protein